MPTRNTPSGRLPTSDPGDYPTVPEELVLCIDDDAAQLDGYAELLQIDGYAPITCSDCCTALDVFRRMAVRLVVLDYSMPQMNGAKIARTMRTEKPNVPIIMLSGHSASPHDVGDAVNAYIVKGQDPRILMREIRRLLERRSAPQYPHREAV